MPDRDGLDLARAVRANPTYDDLRLIMLTSATSPTPEQLAEVDLAVCLSKPTLASEVRSALLVHLAGIGPRPRPETPTSGGRSTVPRVLVVEDNPVNQLVAVGLLEALGYSSLTAEDGEAALVALAEEDFDAVLMDIQMPRMDGYAATRAIRASETDVRMPVIAMTAAAVEGERERCLAAGMDDFLTKPVDPSALAAVLDQWIAGSEEPPRTP